MKSKKKFIALAAGAVVASALTVLGIFLLIKGSKVQVSFRLPQSATAEEILRTRLPEDVKVKKGTLIGELERPDRQGAVFIEWFFDEALSMVAPEETAIRNEVVLYPAFSGTEDYEQEFSLNFVADTDRNENFGVEIVAFGLSEKEVRNEITVRNITAGGKTEKYTLTVVPGTTLAGDNTEVHYLVSGKDGKWDAGEMHQITINNTALLRFVKDGEITSDKITFYNFSIAMEEKNTLSIRDKVTFIRSSEVSGVEVGGGLFELAVGDSGSELRIRETAGVAFYKGVLLPGDVVAVYDGILDKTTGVVDGDVRYIKITGGTAVDGYTYTSPEFEDIVFIPEQFPIEDDGSFDDGTVTVSNRMLDFSDSRYEALFLDPESTLDEGDYIWFYKGDLSISQECETVGFGRVLSLKKGILNTTVIYEIVSEEEVEEQAQFFMEMDNIDLSLSDEDIDKIGEGVVSDMLESGFVEETEQYITALITGEEFDLENSKYSEELKKITFLTDTGEQISLGTLRELANKSNSNGNNNNNDNNNNNSNNNNNNNNNNNENNNKSGQNKDSGKKDDDSKPTISFSISKQMENLEGEGIRIVVEASYKVEIELPGDDSTENKIEIKVACAFEQEIALGFKIKVGGNVSEGYTIKARFDAGTFTGFGASATFQTTSDSKNEKTEWGKLISDTNMNLSDEQTGKLTNIGDKLENMQKTLNTYQNGGSYSKEKGEKTGKASAGEDDDGTQYAGTGGDLQAKYSSMMGNDAEYVNIINKTLGTWSVRVDPFQLIEVSLEADFVVGFKLNAMIGFSVSYENEKEYSYCINIKTKKSSTETVDLKTPCFRSDAYAFGMIGIRAGILLDLRVGFISTKLDSVGVTAEAGIYFEVYGFVYASATWKSGQGFTASAQGSFLVEVGAYLEIKFLAQAGDGKWEFDKDIYSNQWPFWNIGDEAFPLDFILEPDDDAFDIDITDGKGSYKIPSDVFTLKLMELKSGDVIEKNVDSDEVGDFVYNYTIGTENYTQSKEKNFSVYLYDVDSSGQPNGKHTFYYEPMTDEIIVTPESNEIDEAWGFMKITYKTKTFGFNTAEISRKFKLHWKGQPATATVEFINLSTGEVFGTDEVKGFAGVDNNCLIEKALIRKYPGYIPKNIHITDETALQSAYESLRGYSSSMHALYISKGGETYRNAWLNASQKADDAWDKYNNRRENNIRAVVENGGIITFKMEKSGTVIRLEYEPVVYNASFLFNLGGEGGSFGDMIELKRGEKIDLSAMLPDRIASRIAEKPYHEFSWFCYTNPEEDPNEGIKANSNLIDMAIEHRDEWTAVSGDTVMLQPDRNIVFIVLEDKPDYWMVTFTAGGEIYDRYEVKYNDVIITPAPDKITGYFVNGWRYVLPGESVDGTLVPVKARLDRENNLTLEGQVNGNPINVTWNVEGRTFESFEHIGTKISEIDTEAKRSIENAREGYTLSWFFETGEGRKNAEIIPFVTDGSGVTVYGEYSINTYNVTWVEGENVRTEPMEYGTKLTLDKPVDDKELIQYTVEGTEISEGYTVPARDITVTVDRRTHEHAWEKTDRVPSSCSKPGYDEFTCTFCNIKKQEPLALDPEVHIHTVIFDSAENSCGRDGYTGDICCADCGKLLTEGTVIPATGEHQYGMPEIENLWPTCTTRTIYTYTCETCGETYVELSELNPDYHSGRLITSGEVEESCDEDGYSGDLICEDCLAVIEKGEVIPAHGHLWTNPSYEWSGDLSRVTARVECMYDQSHVIEETVRTYVKPWKDMDCTSDGLEYVMADFRNSIFTGQSKERRIPSDPNAHLYGTPSYTWAEDRSTCTARVDCLCCPNFLTETVSTSNKVTSAATCDYNGNIEYTAIFADRHFIKQTKNKSIPALNHDYGEPSYTWSENYNTCTARAVCKNDSSHVLTETVLATVSESAIPDYEKRTATFADEIFVTQVKDVPKPQTPNPWEVDGTEFTIIYSSDIDPTGEYYPGMSGPGTSVDYSVGESGSLRSDLFTVTGWILEEWHANVGGTRYTFDADASFIWSESGSSGGSGIYLPELDPEGSMVVCLTAIHTRKMYDITYYMNNGTSDTFDESVYGYVREVATGTEDEQWALMLEYIDIAGLKAAAGIDGSLDFAGWSTSPTGDPIQTYPTPESVGSTTLALYAIWR